MTQEVRDETRAAWDAIAEGYDLLITPQNMPHADGYFRRVGLSPGMRFLDVAAGTGTLSIPAARLGAEVVAVDISPAMIERLNARARAEGLANLQGRVMDGQALELEDDTFDVAASHAGIMLFPDLPQGLRELVRVTRPGGRALIVAMGSPQKFEPFAFLMGALGAVVPDFSGPPADPPPLPFQLADPEVLERRLVEAGLQDVRVEVATVTFEVQSGKHLWDCLMNGNPISATMTIGLTDAQKAEVQRVLDGMVRERSSGGPGTVLNVEVNVGIGTK
jgi:ubiquinone/menaquinone biosynthesis C-methylase UbiE